jgi:peroxiredoxin
MSTLSVGDKAPDFALMADDQSTVKLSDLSGKTVVLLFYPMDFSPVCTNEHCAFGAGLGDIKGSGDVEVFGVNCDHPFAHAEFRKQNNIPYHLLSDTSREMVKAYGMFAGETPFNCASRGTVVIGPDGTIKAYEPVEILTERKLADIVAMTK